MKEDWIKLEEKILADIQELDMFAKRSPGSGNKGRKGDIVTRLPLHLEMKYRKLKSCYNQDWYDKCKEEVPLHADKIPILATEDKNKNYMVHLSWEDFWEIYKDAWLFNNSDLRLGD